MTVQVRLIQSGEVGRWAQSVSVPFLDPANTEDKRARWERHWRPYVELGRTWAVEDRGRFVGNAAVLSRTVTLPGRPGDACPVVALAALTAVGVHPTHRRRGLLRRLMAAMLDDARERGEAVAGLVASKGSIYGRFGFAPATSVARTSIRTGVSTFAVPAPSRELDLLGPAEAAKVLPGLFVRACSARPGQVNRDEATWAHILADDPEERGDGSARSYVVGPDGFASWTTEEVVDPHDNWGRVTLRDLVAETAGTEAALWRFVLDLDLVREVEAFPRPVDEPIRHRLVDPRQLRTTAVVDFLWLRVLDVAAALSARGYASSGRLVVDVRAPTANPTGPDGLDGPDPTTGRWVLDAGPDGATGRAATAADATDLVLGLAELGALLAGGTAASTLAAAGRVDEETPGALARADGLFTSRPAPLTVTGF